MLNEYTEKNLLPGWMSPIHLSLATVVREGAVDDGFSRNTGNIAVRE